MRIRLTLEADDGATLDNKVVELFDTLPHQTTQLAGPEEVIVVQLLHLPKRR